MGKIYKYGDKSFSQQEIEKTATEQGLSVDDYVKSVGFQVSDGSNGKPVVYVYKDKEFTQDQVEKSAKEQGLSTDEYVGLAGFKKKEPIPSNLPPSPVPSPSPSDANIEQPVTIQQIRELKVPQFEQVIGGSMVAPSQPIQKDNPELKPAIEKYAAQYGLTDRDVETIVEDFDWADDSFVRNLGVMKQRSPEEFYRTIDAYYVRQSLPKEKQAQFNSLQSYGDLQGLQNNMQILWKDLQGNREAQERLLRMNQSYINPSNLDVRVAAQKFNSDNRDKIGRDLSRYEYAGLKTLEVFNPELAQSYINELRTGSEWAGAKKTERNAQLERIALQLETIGRENTIRAAKQTNEVISFYKKQMDAAATPEEKQSVAEMMQADPIVKAAPKIAEELEELQLAESFDDKAYPTLRAIDAVQVYNQTRRRGMSALDVAAAMPIGFVSGLGKYAEGTLNTIDNVIGAVVLGDEDILRRDMIKRGEMTIGVAADKRYGQQSLFNVDAEFSKQIESVLADESLTPDEKKAKTIDLIYKNPDKYKLNPNADKFDLNAQTVLLGGSELMGEILGLALLQRGMGAGVNAPKYKNLAATLGSTGVAMYDDFYKQALIRNSESPALEASLDVAIAWLSEMISPDYKIVRKVLGKSNSPVIAGITEETWNAIRSRLPQAAVATIRGLSKAISTAIPESFEEMSGAAMTQAKERGVFGRETAKPDATNAEKAVFGEGINPFIDDVVNAGVTTLATMAVPSTVSLISNAKGVSFEDKSRLYALGVRGEAGLPADMPEKIRKVVTEMQAIVANIKDNYPELNEKQRTEMAFNMYRKKAIQANKATMTEKQKEQADKAIIEADDAIEATVAGEKAVIEQIDGDAKGETDAIDKKIESLNPESEGYKEKKAELKEEKATIKQTAEERKAALKEAVRAAFPQTPTNESTTTEANQPTAEIEGATNPQQIEAGTTAAVQPSIGDVGQGRPAGNVAIQGDINDTGLILYHGTPHSFDIFDLSKIGTGEGAQAFGYGLYFTNKKAIAENYANILSSKQKFWKALEDGSSVSLSKEDYDFILDELDALGFEGQYAEGYGLGDILVDGKVEYNPAVLDALSVLFGKDAKKELSGYDLSDEQMNRLFEMKKKITDPQLYTVQLHRGKSPNQYDYLNWDSPLTDAQKKKIGGYEGNSGREVYLNIANELGSDKKASEFLLSKGVDGIVFKTDRGTGGGDGTGRNYVVFDARVVTITDINGEVQKIPEMEQPSQPIPQSQAEPAGNVAVEGIVGSVGVGRDVGNQVGTKSALSKGVLKSIIDILKEDSHYVKLKDKVDELKKQKMADVTSGNSRSLSKWNEEIAAAESLMDERRSVLSNRQAGEVKENLENGTIEKQVEDGVVKAEDAASIIREVGLQVPKLITDKIAENKKNKENNTESILGRTTDFFGKPKEDWMIALDDVGVRDKETAEYIKDKILKAIKSAKYDFAIDEGRMTAKDAAYIIESAKLKVPKYIANKVAEQSLKETPKAAKPIPQSQAEPAGNVAQPARTPDSIVAEINSKPLSRVEGLGMGAKEADGLYISTESKNRYATKTNPAKPVKVTIKNPKVTSDAENMQLREDTIAGLASKGLLKLADISSEYYPEMDGYNGKKLNKLTAKDVSQWYKGKFGSRGNVDTLSEVGDARIGKIITEKYKKQGFDSLYFPQSDTEEGILIVFDAKNVKKGGTALTQRGIDASEAKKVHQKARALLDETPPTDAYTLALQYIVGGGVISPETLRDDVVGGAKKAKLNTGERQRKAGEESARDYIATAAEMQRARSRGKSLSVENIAEGIWESLPDHVQEMVGDDMAIKDALIDVVSSFNTRLEASNEVVRLLDYEAQLQAGIERMDDEYVDAMLNERLELERILQENAEEELLAMASPEYINSLIESYERESNSENQIPQSEGKGNVAGQTGKGASSKENEGRNAKAASGTAGRVAQAVRNLKSKPLVLNIDGKDITVAKSSLLDNLLESTAIFIEQTGKVTEGISKLMNGISEMEWYKQLTNPQKNQVDRQIVEQVAGTIPEAQVVSEVRKILRDIPDLTADEIMAAISEDAPQLVATEEQQQAVANLINRTIAENAVQEQSAAGVDVRQQAEDGEGMGEGNAEIPPTPPTGEQVGGDEEGPKLRNKAVVTRIYNSEKVPQRVKDALKDDLKYEPKSQVEASNIAKSIIEEFGVDEAVLRAAAGTFHGDVNSMIFGNALNQLTLAEREAPESGRQAIAEKFLEVTKMFNDAAQSSGRFISAIQYFYQKSPLGMRLLEQENRGEQFREWLRSREGNYQEAFNDFVNSVKGQELIEKEVRERLKKERAEKRTERKKKVNEAIDKWINDLGKQTYSSVVPPTVLIPVLKAAKGLYNAGESVLEIVEKAVDSIDEKMNGADWDRDAFRSKLSNILEADVARQIKSLNTQIETLKKKIENKEAPEKKKQREEDEEVTALKKQLADLRKEYKALFEDMYLTEAKRSAIEKFRNKLKGLSEEQKDKLIRKSLRKLVADGALEFDDFKKMLADIIGMGEMSPEEITAFEQTVKDMNAAADVADEIANAETLTPEMMQRYNEARVKAEKAAIAYGDLVYNKPDITKRLLSYLQLAPLGIKALVTNPFYNVWQHVAVRIPTAVVGNVVDTILYRASQVGNSIWGTDVLYPKNDPRNIAEVQKQFFKGGFLGTKKAMSQVVTGLTDKDYIQKDMYNSRNKPLVAIRDIFNQLTKKKLMTNKQIFDKMLQGTLGITMEGVARLLNVGDKPMRYAAERAEAARFAKELGLKDLELDFFMELPREIAFREYKKRGMTDEAAGEKADEIVNGIIKSGEKSVFQGDNILATAIDSFFEKFGLTGRLFRVLNLPYVKTPLNSLWSLYNLVNPYVALAQVTFYGGRAVANKSRKDYEESKYWLGHAVSGFALHALMGALVQYGIFSPPDEDDESKREREGRKTYNPNGKVNITKLMAFLDGGDPNAVKNGVIVDIQYFGVMGVLGAMITKKNQEMTEEQRKNGMTFIENQLMNLDITTKHFIDQGIFGQTSLAIEAFQKRGAALDQWLLGMINMGTNVVQPAMYAQISRAQLPYYSRQKADDFKGQVKNSILSRSSVLRDLTGQMPPSKISIWGDTLSKGGSEFWDVMGRLFGVTRENDDNFAQPIYEDYMKYNDPLFFPPALKPELDGKKLTAQQYDDLQIFVGQQRKELAKPYVNNGATIPFINKKYSELSKEQKLKALEYIYEVGKENGIVLFTQKYKEFQKPFEAPTYESIMEKINNKYMQSFKQMLPKIRN